MNASEPIIVSGFTLVRNAFKLDYPFRESIESLLPLCQELVINCGDSEDGTADLCEALERKYTKIRVIHSKWELQNQNQGRQLSLQTDRALQACQGNWAFYLQADEVIHERDYPSIRAAIKTAQRDPSIDGVVFDYLHFYGGHNYTIEGRNWYRREVRAFKTGREIGSFRDAQGFRKKGARLRSLQSGARIFHYGYVRHPESLRSKSQEMAKWWGTKAPSEDDAFRLVRHVGLRRFEGVHPVAMEAYLKEGYVELNPKHLRRRWDKNEIKNFLTLLWERVFPFRIGEFRNYTLVRQR